LRHLTPDEIERFAAGSSHAGEGSEDGAATMASRHAVECAHCREDIEAVRAVTRCLAELPVVAPTRSLADAVMADLDLRVPWLDEALGGLPMLEPSTSLAPAILDRVDLPTPWLEAAFSRVPQVGPTPGFASGVMERVRLPIPWRQRLVRFARRRRLALAGAAASSMAVSAAGAVWLFGVQGVTPVQFVTFVLGGVRDLAVRGLVALGGIGYELGLVDAGTALTDISPSAALGGLALLTAAGVLSLLVMARLMRTGPELQLIKNA
jgi:hypothetical protein